MQKPRSWSILAFFVAFTVLHGNAAQAEISFFRLFKTQAYEQTSNAQPTTLAIASGEASILYNNVADFATAQVTSSSPLSPMPLTPSGAGTVSYSQFFATSGDLDTDFPDNTTYAFGISGGTLGTDAAALNTPVTNIYASQVPFFNGTTYDQLQGMDSTSPFSFTFDGYDAPVGGNTPLTFFSIIRDSDGAFIYGDSGPNTQTSFVVPANTLEPGTAYTVDLVYSSRIDTPNAGFNGATAEVGYDLRTDLGFSTAVPEPASICLLAMAGLGLVVCVRRRRSRPVN